jgi:hypothetical protein
MKHPLGLAALALGSLACAGSPPPAARPPPGAQVVVDLNVEPPPSPKAAPPPTAEKDAVSPAEPAQSPPADKPDEARHQQAARDDMFGEEAGDSVTASGGLGLRGTGASSGPGQGIGLGNIGALDHGAGTGMGQGFGSSQGRLGSPPTIRAGVPSASGRLPPEVIQRIARQSFGRFRLCYEQGLRSNPKLAGEVKTRFVIAQDGTVSTVADAGSTMPDAAVTACVHRGFSALSFPAPDGGVVVVVYPLRFLPGDDATAKPTKAPATAAPGPSAPPAVAPAPQPPAPTSP